MRDLFRQHGLFPFDESTLLSQYKDLKNFVLLKPMFISLFSRRMSHQDHESCIKLDVIFDVILNFHDNKINVFLTDKVEYFPSSNVSL